VRTSVSEGMASTDTPESNCPSCGKLLDAASSFKNAVPSPGDFSICINCGHILVFADDLTVRNPTDAEIVEIAGNRDLILMQKALAAAKK
jgi:uncharacterized protein with PIN domain